MKVLEQVYRWSARFAGAVLFLLAVMITADVMKRWITGKPIIGVFEISEVSFLILTFMALGLLKYLDREMIVDPIRARIKGRPKYALTIFAALLGLFFWGFITWLGWGDWLRAYQIHDVHMGLVAIPLVLPLAFLVFGSALLCINLLTDIIINLQRLFLGEKEAASASPGEQ